jgi:hypothetical protein
MAWLIRIGACVKGFVENGSVADSTRGSSRFGLNAKRIEDAHAGAQFALLPLCALLAHSGPKLFAVNLNGQAQSLYQALESRIALGSSTTFKKARSVEHG